MRRGEEVNKWYDILEVNRGADVAEIKRSYRSLALRYHPDKCGGDGESFKNINLAWEVLGDASKRLSYDNAIFSNGSTDGLRKTASGGGRDNANCRRTQGDNTLSHHRTNEPNCGSKLKTNGKNSNECSSGTHNSRRDCTAGKFQSQHHNDPARTYGAATASSSNRRNTCNVDKFNSPGTAKNENNFPKIMPTVEECQQMNIKELKLALSSLDINHTRCIEKTDLLSLLLTSIDLHHGSHNSSMAKGGTASGASEIYRGSTSSSRNAAGASIRSPQGCRNIPKINGCSKNGDIATHYSSGHSCNTNDIKYEKNRSFTVISDAVAHSTDTNGKILRVKVISLGSERSGKSCIIKRYCEGRFVNKYISTIGIDYGVKNILIKNSNITDSRYNSCSNSDTSSTNLVKINFFDFSGNSEYAVVRGNFYDFVTGVILVYDITKRGSFLDLNYYLEEASLHGVNILERPKIQAEYDSEHKTVHFCSLNLPVVLIGNKKDLNGERQVAYSEGYEFARLHNMEFYEASASTGDGVKEALDRLFYNCCASK